MKRVAVVAAIVLIAGGTALWWFVFRPEEDPLDRIELSGTVEAETTEVGSEVPGRVLRIAVQRGDMLGVGDLIGELTTDLGEAQLSQAEAASEAARYGEEGALVAASVQAGVLSAQVSQAERALETAQARLEDLLAGTRQERIRQAEAGGSAGRGRR